MLIPSLVRKSLVRRGLVRETLLAKHLSGGWRNKPADWADIRKDCPANSIALYAGHKTDFSAYDNLGFTATCTGGYNVYIDGKQYGSTYPSGTQCNITWSTTGIATGDAITTPNALKAHKIWIKPALSGDIITRFNCTRVSASGLDQQGVLWGHFNANSINLGYFANGAFYGTGYNNALITAITAKKNILASTIFTRIANTPALTYLPVLVSRANNDQYALSSDDGLRATGSCEFVVLKDYNNKSNPIQMSFLGGNSSLRKVILKKSNFKQCTSFSECHRGNTSLVEFPNYDFSNAGTMKEFATYCTSLKDTILDLSSAISLRIIGAFGNSTSKMTGFKGLRVSSSAPFDYAVSPQINISYTGIDRTGLLQLFNDLPVVTGNQAIKITGCAGAAALTAADLAIATNKGWTVEN